MAKVTLSPSGGLNKDFDANNLPQGDYVSATNIVFDISTQGGGASIKQLESITATGASFSGTIKATFQNVDGYIYVLVRENSTTAYISRLSLDQSSSVKILSYSHSVSTDFVPDLKIIGDIIVWNYYGDGSILSLPLTKYQGTTLSYSADDLFLQKKTPNNVYTIRKTIASAGLDALESSDYQFCSRYQYETGEYSALSAFSQMFKGEKGTTNYIFSFNFSSTPLLVSSIELYARLGNNGVWRRIETRKKSDSSDFTWVGQMYEALDALISSKPFDSIPVNARHIEIAKNRVFLANMQDDYVITDANLDFSINISEGYNMGGGNYISYVGDTKDATSSETSSDGSNFVKPFANNSTYAVGLAYYDAAMKTRGVEKSVKFSTGNFTYPMIPNVTISLGGSYQKPSWAKYIQLCFTKNISKSYIYEGYASNVFFEISKTELVDGKEIISIVSVQNLETDDLKNVRYFVVDLMGMYRAGYPYTLSKGDRITISAPDSSGVNFLKYDMEIAEQKDNFIYCIYNGSEMLCPTIPVASYLYFEIYSPSAVQEEDSLMFFENGNLIPIDTWSGGTYSATASYSGGKIMGDMVFTKIEMPTYAEEPFNYNTVKATPITTNTEANKTFTVSCSMPSGSKQQSSATQGNYTASPVIFTPTISSISQSGSLATIKTDNKSFAVTGFYEAGAQTPDISVLTITYNYTSVETLSLMPSYTDPNYEPQGYMSWNLYSQVYRIPYDNSTNKTSPAVKFGARQLIGSGAKSVEGTDTKPQTFTQKIDLTKVAQDINANDQFYAEVTFEFFSTGDVQGALVNISQGGTFASMVFTGNRIKPKVNTTYKPDAKISETKSKFIFRSISNTTRDKKWNVSAGKPSLGALKDVSLRRTNSIRYSGNYILGTKVNDINSFSSLDTNTVPIENGEIMSLQRASRLQGNGAMLLAICQRETSYIFLGEQDLTQASNSSFRAVTSSMIGTIRNLGGMLGMQEKGSVYNYKGVIWWWDDFNKKVVRYTDEGAAIVSDTYMKSYFRNKSGRARFAYDPYYNFCHITFDADSYSTCYSDNSNRWKSDFMFKADFCESYGDKMIIFRNSSVYKSLQSGFNNLVGNTSDSTVDFILNTRLPVYLKNVAIWHDCNVIDYNTDNFVKSNLLTINVTNENGQATSLVESNFLLEDNRLYAHFLRDANSPLGIIEGDYMRGYLNKIRLTIKDKTQEIRINSLDVDVENVSGHS